MKTIQNRIPPCFRVRRGIARRQKNAIAHTGIQDRAAECPAIGTLLRESAGSGQQCQEQDRCETANAIAVKSRRHMDEVLIVGVRSLGSKATSQKARYLAAYRILTTLPRLLNLE